MRHPGFFTGSFTRTLWQLCRQSVARFPGPLINLHVSRVHVSLDFMGFDPTFFDHQFLVIGRESDSIVTNISSWGLQTVICDPWYPLFPDPKVNRRAYPAYEARSKMLGYLPAGERTLQVLGRWEIPKPTKKR